MDYGTQRAAVKKIPGITVELTRKTNFGEKGEVKEIDYYIAVHLLEKGYAIISGNTCAAPLPTVSATAPGPIKTVALVTTLNNGAGLQKDAELLKRLLEHYGYAVYLGGASPPLYNFRQVDLVIFLELVCEPWFRYSKNFWFMPNSEWFWPCWEQFVPRFSRILCKTHHCHDLWTRKVGESRCVYTGFEATDFYMPEVKKQKRFLHLAGKSSFKNTEAVVEAWRSGAVSYPLTIVGACPAVANAVRPITGMSNVRYSVRVPDVGMLLNEHQYHIIPAQMEGYGHALHEGLGCKAVVITSNKPPMDEFTGIPKDLLVPTSGQGVHCLAPLHFVKPVAVATACHKAWTLTGAEIDKIGDEARAGFLSDREDFHKRLAEVFSA